MHAESSLGKTGNHQIRRNSLQCYSELSLFRGNRLGTTIPVTIIRKTCLLACCINRSSPNCRVGGGCISITFLRWIQISGQAHVTVGRGRKHWSQNMLRPAQTVAKERWGLQGWLWVGYSFRSWFLLKLCCPQSSMRAMSSGGKTWTHCLKVTLLMEWMPWNQKVALNPEATQVVLR